MITFPIPGYQEVSAGNQKYFDFFAGHLGSLPNMYAVMAYSDTALETYWRLHNRTQTLSASEKQIVGLVVSFINQSSYCLETHAMIARLNGFSDEQIREIQNGTARFNKRYHALAQLVYQIVITKGQPDDKYLDLFFKEGYTKENLVDTLLGVGDTIITNLLTCTMRVPSDFPLP